MTHIFAVDIGGTHARFARFSVTDGVLQLEAVVWDKSSGLSVVDDLLLTLRHHLGVEPGPGDTLAVALAGPVHGLTGHLTNGSLHVDLADMALRYGLRHCVLLNDFAAEAYATLTTVGGQARLVCGSEHGEKAGTRAVLGAGTGLGAASLIRLGNGSSAPQNSQASWCAVPSETGHGQFPFVGQKEFQYRTWLEAELGREYISAEDVLCGNGLVRLHRFLTGQQRDAAAVAQEALVQESPTLCWYARFLGRFCRTWICTTLCTGGLWITGGIAARNPLIVTHPAFAAEVGRSNILSEVVDRVPIRLTVTTESGLWGAACAAVLQDGVASDKEEDDG